MRSARSATSCRAVRAWLAHWSECIPDSVHVATRRSSSTTSCSPPWRSRVGACVSARRQGQWCLLESTKITAPATSEWEPFEADWDRAQAGLRWWLCIGSHAVVSALRHRRRRMAKKRDSKHGKALVPRVDMLPNQLDEFDIVELEDRLEFTAIADD